MQAMSTCAPASSGPLARANALHALHACMRACMGTHHNLTVIWGISATSSEAVPNTVAVTGRMLNASVHCDCSLHAESPSAACQNGSEGHGSSQQTDSAVDTHMEGGGEAGGQTTYLPTLTLPICPYYWGAASPAHLAPPLSKLRQQVPSAPIKTAAHT